jgi:colicin import membrane protein
MTAQSPGSYSLSLLIHGAFAGLLVCFALMANRPPTESPKVLELVAGAGNDYGATAAPALGRPDGIKVDLSAPAAEPAPSPAAAPVPTPVPPAPQAMTPVTPPAAVAPSPPAPVPVNRAVAPVKPAVKPAPKAPNFVADLKRLEQKREARLEARYKAQQAAAEHRRITQEQFEREQAARGAGRSSAKVPLVDAEGIAAGVTGGSTANKTGGAGGKALTSEEGSLLDRYFSLLQRHLVEAFEQAKPQDVSDRLSARVAFLVAADGSISHVRFVSPSGNAEFDEAVRTTLAHFTPVGPRPDHRSDEIQTTFTEKSPDA